MVKYLVGRRFQPAALALTIVTFSVGWNRVFAHQNVWYTLIGVLALVLAVAFTASWWINRPALMRWCFLASTFLWVFIAGTSYSVIHNIPSAVSALGWAVLSAGSFWHESAEYGVRNER